MKYIMKSGILYRNDKVAARLKGSFSGPEKKIYSEDEKMIMHTEIRNLNVPSNETRTLRYRKYVILDECEREYITATPDYANGEDPSVAGWPICRLPRVDHAQVIMNDKEYILIMQNSQNYILKEISGEIAIQIFHRGLQGGWNIEATDVFAPPVICGIFAFCKYIEQENEFLIL